MQMPAEHQRRMIKGNTGSLLGWLASCKLATDENKTLHAVVDILTILMAGSVLALHCKILMDPAISNDQTAATDGYGLPVSKQRLALVTLAIAGLTFGFVLEVIDPQIYVSLHKFCSELCGRAPAALAKRKKGERELTLGSSSALPAADTGKVLSLIMLVPVGLRWAGAVLFPTMPVPFNLISVYSDYGFADWVLLRLAEFELVVRAMSIPLFMAAVAMSAMWVAMASAMWYLSAQSMQSSDFSETTIGCSTRSRSARCQHQLLAVKKKSKRKAKRDKRAQSRIVIEPAEYASDSGYSSSGHDEHSSNVAMEDFNRMFSESDEDDGVEASSTIACLGKVQHDIPDCCVCLEEDAATRAVMPCRHLCLCADCGSIGLELCPICREEITDIVLVGDGDSDEFF